MCCRRGRQGGLSAESISCLYRALNHVEFLPQTPLPQLQPKGLKGSEGGRRHCYKGDTPNNFSTSPVCRLPPDPVWGSGGRGL